VVVELDQGIVDSFKKIRWHQLDLNQVLKDKTHKPNFDIEYSSDVQIQEALDEFIAFGDGQNNKSKTDALGQWRRNSENTENYRNVVTKYINSIKIQAIKEHTVERTSFDDDCTFGGLDGSGSYIVAVASCQINGKKRAFRHFFDVSSEEHGYKDKDDLWLNPKKLAVNPKSVTKENLNNLLIKPLDKGLDDYLDQVDVDFKNQHRNK
jgi:hypothetical protein